jgi:diguanylate cyclase (GGDEF)-like protein
MSAFTLNHIMFGGEPKRRLRVQRSMMAGFIYLVWMALEVYAAHTGIIPLHHAHTMITFTAVGLVAFYALLRSGISERLRDPSLAVAQMIYSIGATLLAYILMAPTRSAALQVLCLILVFGMFTLRPRETLQVGAFAVFAVAATMLGLWHFEVAHFDLRHDGINGLMACLIMPALSWLTRHFSQLRDTLHSEKNAVTSALEQVETLATRDPLTGLYNRHHMTDLMAQHCKLSERHGAPLSIAIIDLDHFKRVNDTWGHAVGDEVLLGFARCCQEAMRQSDVVARWGGEEFLLLFPDASTEQALQGLARLRQTLNAQDLTTSRLGLRTTFSAGVAEWTPGHTQQQTLSVIDAALYRAKQGGRDRDVVADGISAPGS